MAYASPSQLPTGFEPAHQGSTRLSYGMCEGPVRVQGIPAAIQVLCSERLPASPCASFREADGIRCQQCWRCSKVGRAVCTFAAAISPAHVDGDCRIPTGAPY